MSTAVLLFDSIARGTVKKQQWIIEALKEAHGVQAQAAKRLGIAERSLWYRVKKYGIDPERFKGG